MAVAVARFTSENTDGFDDAIMTITPASALTSGQVLVLAVLCGRANRTISTIVGGNTGGLGAWTVLHRVALGGTGNPGFIELLAVVCNVASVTIVVTLSGANSQAGDRLCLWELTGISSIVEGGTSTESTTAGATTHNAAAVTPGSVHNILFGLVTSGSADAGSWTPDATFNTRINVATVDAHIVAELIQSSNTAQAFDNTSANSVSSVVALASLQGDADAGGDIRLLVSKDMSGPVDMKDTRG